MEADFQTDNWIGVKMKTKWTKATPTVEGWYWIKYRNKHRTYTICPCYVTRFAEDGKAIASGTVLVRTARNDTFVEGPNHGGPGLKYDGKVDKSIRFGNKIAEPV